MRIAGLASGMDIDTIVGDLMKAERIPLDKLKQKKQVLEWQRDDYRALNTKLLDFRNNLSQLKLTTNYRSRSVASSNENFVTATVTTGAAQSSYSISKVEQLASAATMVAKDKIGGLDPNKALKNQNLETNFWKQGVVESKTFNVKDPSEPIKLELGDNQLVTLEDIQTVNVKVNGQAYKVVDKTKENLSENEVAIIDGELQFGKTLAKDSVVKVDYVINEKTTKKTYEADEKNPLKSWNVGASSLASAEITINGVKQTVGSVNENGEASLGSYGTINFNTGTIVFNPEVKEDLEIEAKFTQNYSSFNINTHTSKGEVSETIFMTGQDSLNNVIRKVNESSAGVTMFYDSFSDQVTLTRKETGKYNIDSNRESAGNDIEVSGSFMTNVLKFNGNVIYNEGQNAKFTINGLETERNSNTFDMSGVTFTLKQTFDSSETGVQAADITVSNDSNQVFENIKEFVNQYNELIKEINGKLTEEKYRSYKPLTDDERESLSEKQQEKWEEMARSGLLKGDPVLSSLLSTMRMDMYSNVETNGLFKQLASIGIKTTANYLEGGKLEIDEAKLKAAIEQDPDAVENLFRGDGTTSDRGIIHKLYDTVDASMKVLQEKAGRATSTNQQFTIGRQLLSVDSSIDRFEDKLKLTEERYWRQFTAMEKAIQKANSQSAYLMQQFYSG